jgi:hypothetical protein
MDRSGKVGKSPAKRVDLVEQGLGCAAGRPRPGPLAAVMEAADQLHQPAPRSSGRFQRDLRGGPCLFEPAADRRGGPYQQSLFGMRVHEWDPPGME